MPDRCTTVILHPQSRLVSKRACCCPVIIDDSKATTDSKNFIYSACRRDERNRRNRQMGADRSELCLKKFKHRKHGWRQ